MNQTFSRILAGATAYVGFCLGVATIQTTMPQHFPFWFCVGLDAIVVAGIATLFILLVKTFDGKWPWKG